VAGVAGGGRNYSVDVAHGALQRSGIHHVSACDLDPSRLESSCIGSRPHQGPHLLAAVKQCRYDLASEIPGAADNQNW
jgi:hypothetical protein